MTHVTCRLTAKNPDQFRNPTLGNRVWATFFKSNNISIYQDEEIRLGLTEEVCGDVSGGGKAMAAAPWDRQTDGRIVVSLNARPPT